MERGASEGVREDDWEGEGERPRGGREVGEREGEKGKDKERREGKRYCSDKLLLCSQYLPVKLTAVAYIGHAVLSNTICSPLVCMQRARCSFHVTVWSCCACSSRHFLP